MNRNVYPLVMLGLLSLLMVGYWTMRGSVSAAGDAQGHSHAGSAQADDHHAQFLADRMPTQALQAMSFTPCVNGFAGSYPCRNLDLMAFMPLADIGGGQGNDIWGWTDPLTGKEYAIMGRTNGTAFVDISDPANPIYLGNLPTHSFDSTWRDMKVYANHAFIVSEASGHGMQVFDLTQLRSVAAPPATFAATAHYNGISTAHNVAINEDSGYAYVVGSNTCGGGLHMVNVQNPTVPVFAGCFSGDGYTHDVQCVNYAGPDPDHQVKEICFAANEDTLTIVDVTIKSAPVMLSRTSYPGVQYAHQGWLSPDHRWFVLDDELDELYSLQNTRTRYFNVFDLDAPFVRYTYSGPTRAIDHNLYIKDNFVVAANYRSGLRIIKPPATEVAYFDIYPSSDSANFNGAWSNYPYFDSGLIIVSGIEQGLFVLRPNAPAQPSSGGYWLEE
ncbi:MAG: choice-of-anchor B family protein [Anaerolineales bacterium]|nr:choice-of-anchor B family protein [Anaerolineales bacterium]